VNKINFNDAMSQLLIFFDNAEMLISKGR